MELTHCSVGFVKHRHTVWVYRTEDKLLTREKAQEMLHSVLMLACQPPLKVLKSLKKIEKLAAIIYYINQTLFTPIYPNLTGLQPNLLDLIVIKKSQDAAAKANK